MLFVTGLATLIGLYASEYMEHDAGLGYCRFFGAFNLFVFSMSCLVMGDNLLMLFLGWEGVGLCSYLLIGYYYKKKVAVDAGMKAFVVNRIGDLGLLIGTLLTFTTFGSVEYDVAVRVDQRRTTATGAPLDATWQVWAIPLLLMAGAFGKSAQLFFYVWLPDAMEGPTPVSALIHAATMVTAGVYLVARMMPLYVADTHLIALTVVTWGGAITAFWAATIAMAQYDIKRIMGYSTISQLGYMFAGWACSRPPAASSTSSPTRSSRRRSSSPAAPSCTASRASSISASSAACGSPGFKIVSIAMLIGCLNLAGFPFTAGYFSKDMILAEAFVHARLADRRVELGGLAAAAHRGAHRLLHVPRLLPRLRGARRVPPGRRGPRRRPRARRRGRRRDRRRSTRRHGHHGFHPHAPKWAINLVLVALAGGSVLAAGLYFVGDHHGWAGGMVHASSAHFDPAHGRRPRPGGRRAPRKSRRHAREHGTILGMDPHKVMYYISASSASSASGSRSCCTSRGGPGPRRATPTPLAKALGPVHRGRRASGSSTSSTTSSS
jgi:NADH-quinone oxidoreductase subunit L